MARRKSAQRASPAENRFYARVLDEAEKLDLAAAEGVNGIDEEIALLRVKIKSILEKDPENVKLIIQLANTIAGLVRTKYSMTKDQRRGLKEAIGNVIRDIAIPLGVNVGSDLLKKKLGGT
ncbi:MAG: hypothetical protein N2506_04010 [Dehalococcoidales bacterium]|nr:hypothetical protein [Dehalococcoidales bacterium]